VTTLWSSRFVNTLLVAFHFQQYEDHTWRCFRIRRRKNSSKRVVSFKKWNYSGWINRKV